MFKLYSIIVVAIFLFTGCNQSDVKVVKKNYFKTKLGTIENQKLVTKLPEVKKPVVVKKIKPKKKKKINPTVAEKKQRFKNILVPIVTEVYITLQKRYKNVKRDIEQNKNQEYIEKLKVDFKADNNKELLQALKPHPISITLAQAAIESAWLTSRFTLKANNIFGVWSFRTNEPRIEASDTRGAKKIYLKKYKNYRAAVADYYRNLARNWAYVEFREQRTLTNDPYHLVPLLESYSEKREKYTKLLASMIKYNKFDQYDIK